MLVMVMGFGGMERLWNLCDIEDTEEGWMQHEHEQAQELAQPQLQREMEELRGTDDDEAVQAAVENRDWQERLAGDSCRPDRGRGCILMLDKAVFHGCLFG